MTNETPSIAELNAAEAERHEGPRSDDRVAVTHVAALAARDVGVHNSMPRTEAMEHIAAVRKWLEATEEAEMLAALAEGQSLAQVGNALGRTKQYIYRRTENAKANATAQGQETKGLEDQFHQWEGR